MLLHNNKCWFITEKNDNSKLHRRKSIKRKRELPVLKQAVLELQG